MPRGPTPEYRLSDEEPNVHYRWDNSLEPVVTVDSGSVIEFVCRDGNNEQITPTSEPGDLANVDIDQVHPLTGPVAVDGADPGDVLEVELLGFDHHGWGLTGVWPGDFGLGLLADEFPEPALHIWTLEGSVGHFVSGIEVPLDPFPGTIGVAPNAAGRHRTIPPRSVGGNIDVKQLTAGSRAFFPIEVEGGLFSIGDCHGAQGDGEVCVTALEAPMTVRARLTVRTDRAVEQPEFHSSHPYTPTGRDEPMYGTTGIAPSLMEASRLAVRHMIRHLVERRGLSAHEAYMLCSVAVDLRINQLVNDPNWTVSAHLPESIFPDGPAAADQ